MQKRSPSLAGQDRFQGTDALGRYNRDAFGLAREAEKLLVARGFVLADSGEVLIFVADEENLAEVFLRMLRHVRYAIQDGSLEVELHHDAHRAGQAWIQSDGEIQSTNFAVFDEPSERRKGFAKFTVCVGDGVVAFRRWAERALHARIVVEKRQENGDAFDNGSSEFRFDSAPIVVKPSFDRFKLLAFERIGIVWRGLGEGLEFDNLIVKENAEAF